MEEGMTDLELAYDIIDDWIQLNIPEESIEFYGLTLPFLPDLPPNATSLVIRGCMFETPLKIPPQITHLDLSRVPLVDQSTFHDGLRVMQLMNLNPFEFTKLPSALRVLDIENVGMTTLPALPETLEDLSLDKTLIQSLPALPKGLEYLTVWNTDLKTVPPLPPNLLELKLSNTWVQELPPLPPTIYNLICESSPLRELPCLPNSLQYLSVADTPLKAIPPLPPKLDELYCSRMNIRSLPSLPNTLKSLSAYGCKHLTSLPPLPESLRELYIEDTAVGYLMFPKALRILECARCPNLVIKPASELETLEEYKKRWMSYEKDMAHWICKAIKEELMMNRWHPDRVYNWMETGMDVEDM